MLCTCQVISWAGGVCVCVCACVRACVRARVCVCVCREANVYERAVAEVTQTYRHDGPAVHPAVQPSHTLPSTTRLAPLHGMHAALHLCTLPEQGS